VCGVDVRFDSLRKLKPKSQSQNVTIFHQLGLTVLEWIFVSRTRLDASGNPVLPPIFVWIDEMDRFKLYDQLVRRYRAAARFLYLAMDDRRERQPFDVMGISAHARFMEDAIGVVIKLIAAFSIAFDMGAAEALFQQFVAQRVISERSRQVKFVKVPWMDLMQRISDFAVLIGSEVTEDNIVEKENQKVVVERALGVLSQFVELGVTLISLAS